MKEYIAECSIINGKREITFYEKSKLSSSYNLQNLENAFWPEKIKKLLRNQGGFFKGNIKGLDKKISIVTNVQLDD